LQEAIIDADPSLKGQIDRFGNYLNEDGQRYSIHPYMLYRKESDLYRIHTCAVSTLKRSAAYYRCFVSEHEERDESNGRRPPGKKK
jgi:hypothetical protein